jgi:UDP-GlcNAc3NAcA epimerase
MKRTSASGKTPFRLVTVVGARPQFVKAAAVSRAVAGHNRAVAGRPIAETLIHTGQHYDRDMSGIFFAQLDLPRPDHNLGVGSGPPSAQTAAMMARLEPLLDRLKPDAVLVYGDTNSTLAGALTAAKLGLSVAHVEAGLRSFNRAMPEEINRILTDHAAARLFCPTAAAMDNLRREGLDGRAHLVGDVMYDSFRFYLAKARRSSRVLEALGLRRARFGLATVHRAGNTDDPARLRDILAALGRVARERFPVVLPLHPRTRAALGALKPRPEIASSLLLTTPLPYFDMLVLTAAARLVLTDSGGLQKEAFFARRPCLTLREETEWVETVAAGRNFLAGSDPARIEAAVARALAAETRKSPPLYGRGDAARRIVRILVSGSKGA